MQNRLAGHTNSYHTYDFDQALTGIAEAGYDAVELTAVLGWTEHVDLDAPQADLRARLAHYGLDLTVLSAHQGGALVRRVRRSRHEHGDRWTLESGRERVCFHGGHHASRGGGR